MKALEIYSYVLAIFIVIIEIFFLLFYKTNLFVATISTAVGISITLLFNYSYLKAEGKISEEINRYYNRPWILITVVVLLVLNTLYAFYSRKFVEIHFGGGGIIDLSDITDIHNTLFYTILLLFQIDLIILLFIRIKKVYNIKKNYKKVKN